MKENGIGFNSETREKITLEDFKDHWTLITLKKGDRLTGVLSQINNGEIGLLPYQKSEPIGNGSEFSIEEEGLPYMLKREDIAHWRPTSKESTQMYCKNMNIESYAQKMVKERELSKLSKELNNKPDIIIIPRMARLIR